MFVYIVTWRMTINGVSSGNGTVDILKTVTTLYSTLLHTYTSVHSHVFISRCLVVAFNGGHSLPPRSRNLTALKYQLLTAIALND
jgi:hypothetical protein